jgi:acetyl-CoA carboxylase biotin carboxyl carrier protein
MPTVVAVPTAPPAPAEPPAHIKAGASEAEEGLVAIRSPMVGTFYRAPNPTAPSYCDVGAKVGIGTVVCIVEAMKLMNEIESEVAGTIDKILVENGKPVEFNQPLFLLRPE